MKLAQFFAINFHFHTIWAGYGSSLHIFLTAVESTKRKKGMMMVVFWSKATRVSGHQLHVSTSQKPFSLRGIHKLKLRWFVIFWSLHCSVQWPCNILFTLKWLIGKNEVLFLVHEFQKFDSLQTCLKSADRKNRSSPKLENHFDYIFPLFFLLIH